MWRFAGNEDQEGIDLINKDPSEKDDNVKILKCFIHKTGELRPCETPEEEKLALEPEAIISRKEKRLSGSLRF